jgi:hypothetical protein
MTATLDQAAAIVELQRQLDERTRQLEACRAELAARNSEFGERIEHQSATIDVLKAMSASPGDPQPVFDLSSVSHYLHSRQRRLNVSARSACPSKSAMLQHRRRTRPEHVSSHRFR